jgi:hypothetical protein
MGFIQVYGQVFVYLDCSLIKKQSRPALRDGSVVIKMLRLKQYYSGGLRKKLRGLRSLCDK